MGQSRIDRASMLASCTALALALLAVSAAFSPTRAEVADVKIAKQYGISYLPLMLMEADKLVEKHATAAGLPDLRVAWATFASGSAMNDAILSGSLQFASGGVGPLATLWDKTHGTIDVRCVTAMSSMPLYLTTRNPAVHTIKDLTPKDRIALPAVKVSSQAVILQMAAEQAFGPGQHTHLDSGTVSMSHPDGLAALLSGAGEVTAHLSGPPFQYQELKHPGIRRILSSYDVQGGRATFNVIWATGKFRSDNPKVFKAFLAAYEEATNAINADKPAAARRYLDIARDKRSTAADILAMLLDPEIVYTMAPERMMSLVGFMHRTGRLKNKPESWKDLCFEDIHKLPGS